MGVRNCQIDRFQGCCCTCRYRVSINCHPWNKDDRFKGDITKTVTYGCAFEFSQYIEEDLDASPIVTINDSGHGICECWSLID